MTALNRDASPGGARRRRPCATDVTGFGLLGHLYKLARASGVSAVVDAAAVPYLDGAREALADGYVPGGSRRNLDWVRPHLDVVRRTRTSWSCSPTPRPPAGCWSRGSCPDIPSSVTSSTAASTSSRCAERHRAPGAAAANGARVAG